MTNNACSSCEELLFGRAIKGPLLYNNFIYDLFSILNNVGFPSIADNNTPYVIGDGVKQVI